VRTYAAALVAALALLAGCSSDPPRASQPVPSPTAAGGAPDDRAVAAAADEITSYLDDWAAHGAAHASRHLVAAQRAATDDGMPVLVQGRLGSYEVSRWRSPSDFTLMVSMDLRFDGSPEAWNSGDNTRFVTVQRHGRGYLLELATSP
jgi:hypothetical protein